MTADTFLKVVEDFLRVNFFLCFSEIQFCKHSRGFHMKQAIICFVIIEVSSSSSDETD